jgi:hypothetical protein
VIFDESIRGVNEKMKLVDTPGVGCIEPMVEARTVQTCKRRELQKMRRYGAGVPPLKRISNLEKDLEKILSRRRRFKPVVSQAFLSPPKTRQQNIVFIDTGSRDIGQNPLKMTDQTPMTMDDTDSSAKHLGGDGTASVIFSECSSVAKGANDEDSLFGGSVKSGRMELSVPTDLKVLRPVNDSTAFALATKAKRDETRKLSAKGSARSTHTPGGSNVSQLYRLDCKEDSSVDLAFQHTRDQLLSKKGKVYDCGPGPGSHAAEPSSPGSRGQTRSGSAGDPDQTELGSLSMPFVHGVLSADEISGVLAANTSQNSETRPITAGPQECIQSLDPRQTMPSRYADGKNHLTERRSQNTIPGYIRSVYCKLTVSDIIVIIDVSLCADGLKTWRSNSRRE